MKPRRSLSAQLWALFIETLVAALAEGLVAGLAWIIRKWRKKKNKKQKKPPETAAAEDNAA